MGVSKNRGTPKWMVKIMENPIKIHDLGGFTPVFGLTPICQHNVNQYIPFFASTDGLILIDYLAEEFSENSINCTMFV